MFGLLKPAIFFAVLVRVARIPNSSENWSGPARCAAILRGDRRRLWELATARHRPRHRVAASCESAGLGLGIAPAATIWLTLAAVPGCASKAFFKARYGARILAL